MKNIVYYKQAQDNSNLNMNVYAADSTKCAVCCVIVSNVANMSQNTLVGRCLKAVKLGKTKGFLFYGMKQNKANRNMTKTSTKP